MIYIVRHGQTNMNKAHVMQGRSEHPLNGEGERQAMEAGRKLRERGISFSRVYSSPLGRAVATARIISGAEDIKTDERLIEMDYGPYEGTKLENLPPELLNFFKDFVNTPAPEGMEPLAAVTARMGSFLEEIKPLALEGDILIATHALAMKGALEYLTPDSRGGYWSKYIGNCAVYATELKDGEYTVPVEMAFGEMP
ncbi:MAG: histidine phosphatase family protein [Clostridia bacterium]|nr:histidine phosphatase family protein [Clostridia bacterium]